MLQLRHQHRNFQCNNLDFDTENSWWCGKLSLAASKSVVTNLEFGIKIWSSEVPNAVSKLHCEIKILERKFLSPQTPEYGIKNNLA